jgi:hypothetical protein
MAIDLRKIYKFVNVIGFKIQNENLASVLKLSFNFLFDSCNCWTTGTERMKCYMKVEYNHPYKLFFKHYLQVNNYKHGDTAKLKGYM